LKGFVEIPQNANRGVCYCKDCQAFAHFLGKDGETLDERGGTDVTQVLPKNIAFTQGTEILACIRLTEKGLLRWYAGCCNTPVVNTQGARGSPKPRQAGAGGFALRFIASALKARFNGSYKATPFFHDDGTPIVAPRILTGAELAQVMRDVG
jgi:hypothetical protein